MKITFFILVIMGLWALYKYIYARKVVGKVIELKPIRKKTNLTLFCGANLKVDSLYTVDGNWLVTPLMSEVTINEKQYDYLMITTKNPDDNINKKKAVVCHVKAGSSLAHYNDAVFIDWGLVRMI